MSLSNLITALRGAYPSAKCNDFTFDNIDSALAIHIEGTDVHADLRSGPSNKDQIDLTYGLTLPEGFSPVDDFFPTVLRPKHLPQSRHLRITCRIWGQCINESTQLWASDEIDVVRLERNEGKNPSLQLRGITPLRQQLSEGNWLIFTHQRNRPDFEAFSLKSDQWENPSKRSKEVFIGHQGKNNVTLSYSATDATATNSKLSNRLIELFIADCDDSALTITPSIGGRLIASLLAKRFLVITGLAGSGKTKIAQAFARWITADPGWRDEADHSKGKNPNPYYSLVPVGADWTGNDNVLGYPDGIRDKTYNSKPALDLILHAGDHLNEPHFLILDEMNLSHVERYFSDILSAIESGEPIPLHSGVDLKSGPATVPSTLVLPENLFIIGTVNVDETTYMFSPKVLDRANVIEFKMDETELDDFLDEPKSVRLDELDGKGEPFGKLFATAAADKTRSVPESIKPKFKQEMLLLFNLLQKHQAEFGYRTSYEAARFVHFYKELGGFSDETDEYFAAAMDAVIVQKLLPKLHGSRSKLEGLLWALIQVCAAKRPDDMIAFTKTCHEAGKADSEALAPKHFEAEFEKETPDVPYPLSFNKLMRMHRKLVRDQFVTFSEA